MEFTGPTTPHRKSGGMGTRLGGRGKSYTVSLYWVFRQVGSIAPKYYTGHLFGGWGAGPASTASRLHGLLKGFLNVILET
jgi:hypothetical protein